jgi:formylglycine-generating enzyme required for sulfatase activity
MGIRLPGRNDDRVSHGRIPVREAGERWAAHAGGELRAECLGLYDVHGNVLQWCRDAYAADYKPQGLPGDADRVARGGLFNFSAADCRAARRHHFPHWARRGETYGFPPIGFRVVVRARPSASQRQSEARGGGGGLPSLGDRP